jgi:hypothetical protein
VGWAIMIGTAVYAGYEAYKSTEIDWNKLENGIYDAADLAMFRVGFTMARQQFLTTAAGAAAQQAGYVDRVPLREQRIQGGFITAAAIVQAFRVNDNVLAYVL